MNKGLPNFQYLLLAVMGSLFTLPLALANPPHLPPIVQTVGPKGGTISLPNGTELMIGSGAFSAATEVRVYPVEGRSVRGGSLRFQHIGWGFRVEPSLKNAKVNLRVPTSLTPPGFKPHLLKLDLIGPPLCDGKKCKGNFYISGGLRTTFSWFDISGLDTTNILQVAIRRPKSRP